MSRFSTRAQRIVGYLENAPDLPKPDLPRLAKLAGLIQRNGLLQTVVFLEAKANKAEGEDAIQEKLLLKHLRGAVKSALNREEDRLQRSELAGCAPTEYLLLTEVALEAATWMARHAEARQPPKRRS
jgi:CRISPR type III-B/RAMP module-associated protein Cmr5